jgi:hypothetical protein
MKSFRQFVNENYFSGVSKSTASKKKAQMKKQADMDDDDPNAYKEMPGDKKGKKNQKTSKHTKKYHELYNESVNEGKKYEEVEWIAPTKTFDYFGTKMTIKKGEKGLLISYESDEQYLVDFQDMRFYAMDGHQVKKTGNSITESVNEADDDDKQSTKRGPIDSAKIEKALKTKADETDVPIGIIRAVMRRGMAAWKTGHRPGATQEQWGYARVNAFLTKGEGTWGKADKDLAKEVRDGGHDKKLKK